MRLYYFTSERFALESLRDKRLKVARFTELNDPFDFLGIALDLPSQRYHLSKLKKILDESHGLLCMSTTWQEPLLWGHYADKHKGICLGFDVNPAQWLDVIYAEHRPTLETYGVRFVEDLSEENLENVARTKGQDWKYEAEMRTFVELKAPDLVTEFYFQPFSEDMKLRQIIVGERSSATRSVIGKLVDHNGGGIESFKARAAFNEYKVVHQRREDKWE